MPDKQTENDIDRADQLKADRGTLDSHCEQVREVFYPTAAAFVSKQTLGEKLHQKVYDSTGEQAGEILAAGIHAMTCDNAEKWFSLSTGDVDLDQDEAVAAWLERTADKLYRVYNSPLSGFTTNKHEQLMELVHFGTGPLFIGDRPGSVPFFQSRPMGQTYIAENGNRVVDTVFWRPQFRAEQTIGLFGPGNVSEKVRKAAEDPKKKDQPFDFIHAVYPRDEAGRKRPGARGMAFVSRWIEVAERKLVRESGFEEFPYSCPRWHKRANEVYGRSPGMKVLADCRMLQRAMRTQIRGVEKIVDPPWLVADDGVLNPLRVNPSGTNVVRGESMGRSGGPPIQPMLSGARPDLAEEFMNGVRTRIENGFHTNLFQFARDPQMTATQFLGITEQTMRALSPVLGRLQSEDLGPMTERLFGIMWRAGMIDPPPPALEGRDLKVVYVSPLAKQQRIGEARAVADWFQIMAPALQLDPTLVDIMDGDKAGRLVADLIGIRKDVMRAAAKVDEIRNARTQAMMQQHQADQMRASAETGAKVIQALPALKEGLTPQTQVQGNA